MAKPAALTVFTVGLAMALVGVTGACSDDPSNKLAGRGSSGGSSGSGGGGSSGVDSDGGSSGNPGGPPPEEVLFRAVEPDFTAKCGGPNGTCHVNGTYKPTPPTFLAGPDAYKSVKAQPGAIVADYYQSVLLQKGAHAGPAVGADPTFEAKMIAWLQMEAAVIQSQTKPSTDPVSVVAGPNDIDLTKACVGGLTGVHMKFTASLVGDILSISNITIVAPAGTDVHVYKPAFVKVLAAPNAEDKTDIVDGADTFSNTDQTVPGGTETVLAPGSAFFTADGWTPFNLATDKIRIEVDKLEPGKVQVVDKPVTCKDPAAFGANVLPQMRSQQAANGTCGGCHNNSGLGGMMLTSNDFTLVCNQVIGKMNAADISKSLIITKVAPGGTHGGGAVNNPTGWLNLFTTNKAVFF